uniref:T-cell surface antigen CD2 n=1 Tax=Doryrhamphus excisus TaxID=161450 RepID=UPI0025AE1D83|nr:T-cell surface antigen CD2 [Doryrhamphus excisus]
MERMAAASSVVLFMLCSSFLTCTGSQNGCDAYGAIGGNFTVPLHHRLQKLEDLRWRHNKTKIFHQRPDQKVVFGKPDNIHGNGSLKLLNMGRSSAGIYIPEVYDTKGVSVKNLKSLFLCLLDPISKPGLKMECESSNVKFTCMTGQTPDVTLQWFENDNVLPKEDGRTLLRVANEVTNSMFRCKVSNRASSMSSDSHVQNCTKSSSSLFPEELFGQDFRMMVSILASMGGLALLLIVILIVCCIRGIREKSKQVEEEEELRLGWTNPKPQHHQYQHPTHRHQPADHTGPRQHRRKKRGMPQHLGSQPQPHLAQASRLVADEGQPPPVPQPRKKVAATNIHT